MASRAARSSSSPPSRPERCLFTSAVGPTWALFIADDAQSCSPDATPATSAVDIGVTESIHRPPHDRNGTILSRFATIYAVSEDRKDIRALGPDDLRGGQFRDGGREIVFPDGRTKLTGLAMRRSELAWAIDALKRRGGQRGEGSVN